MGKAGIIHRTLIFNSLLLIFSFNKSSLLTDKYNFNRKQVQYGKILFRCFFIKNFVLIMCFTTVW